jgi:hypothetical protein
LKIRLPLTTLYQQCLREDIGTRDGRFKMVETVFAHALWQGKPGTLVAKQQFVSDNLLGERQYYSYINNTIYCGIAE